MNTQKMTSTTNFARNYKNAQNLVREAIPLFML